MARVRRKERKTWNGKKKVFRDKEVVEEAAHSMIKEERDSVIRIFPE